MSALVMALAFVACESDKDEPTPELTFKVGEEVVVAPIEVEVGATVDVTIVGGNAEYTIVSSDTDEELVTVSNEGDVITVKTVLAPVVKPEPAEDGDDAPAEPKDVTVSVSDKDGVKGEFKVTVTPADKEGEGEGEGEE